jgi:hypothetical protein
MEVIDLFASGLVDMDMATIYFHKMPKVFLNLFIHHKRWEICGVKIGIFVYLL